MFNVNQTLIALYDACTTDQERARVGSAFYRNKTSLQLDNELTDAMEEACDLCDKETDKQEVKDMQADTMDYMEKLGTQCSTQVLRNDVKRIKTMLEVK